MNNLKLQCRINRDDYTKIVQTSTPSLVLNHLLATCLPLYPTGKLRGQLQNSLRADCLLAASRRALDNAVVSVFDYVEDTSRRTRILHALSQSAHAYRQSLSPFSIPDGADESGQGVFIELQKRPAHLLDTVRPLLPGNRFRQPCPGCRLTTSGAAF